MFTKLRALSQNQTMMKYVKNSSWMIAEYGLRIISAVFVSIYVARYLGPELFGALSYVLAIVAIFMAISRLGMESILVRDLAKYPEKAKAYMSTVFGLMVVSAIVGLIILSTLIYFFESDMKTKFYIWIISTGLLFQTLLVIDYNFQAQVKAKYSSIAKAIALAISSGVKIYLVWIQADLQAFAFAHAFDHLIIAIMLVVMHLNQKQQGFVFGFDIKLVKPLLRSAWPMVLTATSVILYMRIDQIMINHILGSESLGIYMAASKLFEGWIMLPYIISISLITVIINFKEKGKENFENFLTKVYLFVIWFCFIVALASTIFSTIIIDVVFGALFSNASLSFSILMWVAIFSAINSLNARYFTIQGMEKKIAHRTIVALCVNVLLNVFFIPLWGIEGAALATLVSTMSSAIIVDYFDADTKQLNRIKINALFFKFDRRNING